MANPREPIRSPGRPVFVNHLPEDLIKMLDRKYGQLLSENGGFGSWLLRIDGGKFRYIEQTTKEFLEPTHEARKQQPLN